MIVRPTFLNSILLLIAAWMCFGPAAVLQAQDIFDRKDDSIPAEVETIYTKGLRYLAENQSPDGSWRDGLGTEPGVVGLTIAAFLAHGEDPINGDYAATIRKGLEYILSKQNPQNGQIGNTMYSHAFATKALAESYGMVDMPKIGPALKKAIELILNAQKRNALGGWRYTPESTDADTTVTGCQMVALYAARNAGIPIPDESLRKGIACIAKNRCNDGGYGYTSATSSRPTLGAIGTLCMSLAKQTTGSSFAKSVEYLQKNIDYRDRQYPYYYEYYMSQALFHADEPTWREWNARNIRYMATLQNNDGSFPGNQGTIFSTAGALLSLALNYRFLPIYEK